LDEKVIPQIKKSPPSTSQILSPIEAMELAIAEAWGGWGHVSPNPLVGCVILSSSGQFISSGYHALLGHDHAEIRAIKNALDLPADTRLSPDELAEIAKQSGKLSGCDMYVTLEPCAHQGRTPACAATLVKIGLGRLTYAVEDPNPKVSGGGAKILRDSGVQVFSLGARNDIHKFDRDRLIQKSEEVAAHFLHRMRTGQPYITLKVASSLDGRIALKSGESKWLTSESARSYAHLLRAGHEAVLVGRRTIEIDNPLLSVRHPAYPAHSNRVVLIDPNGELAERMSGLKVFSCRPPENIICVLGTSDDPKLAHAMRRLDQLGVKYINSSVDNGRVDLKAVASELLKFDIYSIYVEGGADTLSQMLFHGLAQKLELFVAPKILGSQNSISWTETLGFADLRTAPQGKDVEVRQLGPDFLFSMRL
jgi:diaminohydroxyphosphoribosylaminopyrimidine deaminase / 5-amino-6-(5-phosphoribosylamino)uracil reductase